LLLSRYKGTNPLEEFMTDSLKAYNEMWNNIKRNTVYSVMVYNPESSVAK
jgi:preprotein translocase subunit SecA